MSVASPLFFVHAFYQLLLGAVVVFLAALWRHGGSAALGHALAGVVVGVLFVHLLGPLLHARRRIPAGRRSTIRRERSRSSPRSRSASISRSGSRRFVAVGWRRFVAGLAVLGLTQTAGLLALQPSPSTPDLTAHVRDVRGWAVAGPVLIFAAVVNVARPRR